MSDPFYLTAAVLAVAAVVGLLANRLRQPLIVAFIAVGILVGPSVLGWVQDAEPLELFAEIGIAVLLFLVGLKLDLRLVRATGSVALVTGLGQVAFTSIVGFGLAMLLGMDATTALYVGIALTFSSTIIVVKLLSDKREIDELHGRIALGFLIVQDIVVVLVMIVLSSFGGDSDRSLAADLGITLASGLGFVVGLAIAMRWVLPWVLHRLAASQELLLVGAVAWAVSLAALGDLLGFSTEVGAFLAGFALASTSFRDAISSSLTPLRDFLLLFFFIELGSQLDFSTIGSQVPAALVLSAFVLIGNPVIVLIIMGVMGYRRRVGFLAGLTVAQISEFSLIFVALGLTLGHIGNETVGLVTLVGLVTIGLSTYMILYSHPLYDRLAPYLRIFERAKPSQGDEPEGDEPVDVVVYGYGRYGRNLAWRLADGGHRVLVVDWDPQAAAEVTEHAGLDVVFGDAEDNTYPSNLPLSTARVVVSTVARVESNRILAKALRRWGFDGTVAVTAHTTTDAEALDRDLPEADLVLRPFHDASEVATAELIALLHEPGGHAAHQRDAEEAGSA
ncbi:cation:proton antiporter [Rhabdothermincola salaria]|uniref:cation:proton antiporter n=1 Tax=Rhabdothermincola salaria TaxID=2903142 RepID=UPI001E4CE6CF|nr:cation:proton antiporter [Rhabdothermincola salaria]MCD9622909.1 cation:proton antiporter [Rhabdothermincola salaria]